MSGKRLYPKPSIAWGFTMTDQFHSGQVVEDIINIAGSEPTREAHSAEHVQKHIIYFHLRSQDTGITNSGNKDHV